MASTSLDAPSLGGPPFARVPHWRALAGSNVALLTGTVLLTNAMRLVSTVVLTAAG